MAENTSTIKSGVILVKSLGEKCNLLLNERTIKCTKLGQEDLSPVHVFTLPLEDVVGLRLLKVPLSSHSNACAAELFTYRKEKKCFSKKFQRKLLKETIEFSTECENAVDFDANYKIALEWREAIQLQCIRRKRQIFAHTPEQIDRFTDEPLHLLVIINPFAGKKKGEHLYEKVVQPLFEIAGVVIVHKLITERQGHAREFIETFDLSQITGIVLSSGDGIVYEIVNGLMARHDWETAIKTPIGVLPTGSGNALVSSLIYEANEGEGDPLLDAVMQIINGGIQSHDIASVQTESSGHMYMTVLMHWALTGTVDIESEKLRFLGGELRLLIGGLISFAIKKEYHGQLSYLPIEEEGEESKDGSDPPLSLTDPVPDNWITIDGKYIIFAGLMCPCISDGIMGHPDLKCGSGELWIVYAPPDITRMQLVSKMSETATVGTNFYTIRTREFRLTPITSGIISIDGEMIEYGPVHVRLLPNSAMRLFSRKKTQ